jgi:hypothetical protein
MSSTTTTTVTTSATTTTTSTTIQPDLIHEVIDRQCARLGKGSYRRVAPEDLGPLLYGIVQGTQCRITFYVSYSTWDGRFLYVDHVMTDSNDDDGQ